MRKDMNEHSGEKKKTRIAGKVAILCTAVMIAAGGAYVYQQRMSDVPELTTFVDHHDDAVVIGPDEVPMAPEPKVTKDTQTSRKTVKLKKPAKKTYTKKSTKTKESTDEEKNGSNVVVTETTVVTVKKQKFKKNSKKKVVITKVTTTTKTSVESANKKDNKNGKSDEQVKAQAAEENGKRTVAVDTLAPKLNSTVMNAYKSLGFTITIDPSVSYSGYFNARNQQIILRAEGDTVYHEIGHFLAFVAGNVDKTADFTAIYNEEKGNYSGSNTNYVTQNASEYFAESFRDYTLNPSALASSRPKTYQAIVDAVSKVTDQQINKIKTAYGPIWK